MVNFFVISEHILTKPAIVNRAAAASMDVSHGFAYFIEGPRSIVGGRFKHPLATIKQLLRTRAQKDQNNNCLVIH